MRACCVDGLLCLQWGGSNRNSCPVGVGLSVYPAYPSKDQCLMMIFLSGSLYFELDYLCCRKPREVRRPFALRDSRCLVLVIGRELRIVVPDVPPNFISLFCVIFVIYIYIYIYININKQVCF